MSTKKQQEIGQVPTVADGYAKAIAEGYRLVFIGRDPKDAGVFLIDMDKPAADGEDKPVGIRDRFTDAQFEELLPVLKDEIVRYELDHLNAVAEQRQADEPPYDGPAVYSWLIPGERGYALEIKVPSRVDLDTARAMALELRIGAEGEDEGRGLSELERVYVASVEPAIVRDTVDVTLDHQRALEANERLARENDAFATAKEVFTGLGIDPEKPIDFVDRVHEQADGRILAADAELAGRREQLSSELLRAVAHLREVAVMTGFAKIEPPAPAEPDYSALVIVVDDVLDVKGLYPRLADAVWVEQMPGAPMTDDVRAGYLLTATRIRENFRMKFGAGETEMLQFDAFLAYLDVEIGKPE